MKRIFIRKEAEDDLNEVFAWYEDIRVGLGEEFIESVEHVLNTISRSPKIYPSVHEDIRRAFTRKFPFGIFYFESGETIIVLAVMHARKHPSAWRGRT